jgi:hypothetical protein
VKKTVVLVVVSLVGAFILIQLVPYRISNAKVTTEPHWDSPRTRELAVRACYDCHSDEVKVPWYGHVAPVSWWMNHHVEEGRAALNFSQWDGSGGEEARRAARTVRDGSMPPSYFTWFGLHHTAKLTPAEQDELVRGLEATFGTSGAGTDSVVH